MLKPISIRLKDEVWRQAKIAATIAGKSLQDWLTEAIQEKLSKSSLE